MAGNEERTKQYKNGLDTFISTFRTSAPVDIVIVSLGTNDLQLKCNKTSKKISKMILLEPRDNLNFSKLEMHGGLLEETLENIKKWKPRQSIG